MKILPEVALTYDDVLLVPGKSSVSANARRAVPHGQGTPGMVAKSTAS